MLWWPPLVVRTVEGVGPQVNKFVSSKVVFAVPRFHVQGGGEGVGHPGSMSGRVPHHVTYPMMHLMLTTPPLTPVNRLMPVKTLPFPYFICGR